MGGPPRSNPRLKKDAVIGAAYGEYVMGGCRFLMHYHNLGHKIYMFWFSCGAYVARFLAEMLHFASLFEPGNGYMMRSGWNTFALVSAGGTSSESLITMLPQYCPGRAERADRYQPAIAMVLVVI